jgi:hypothetical protein
MHLNVSLSGAPVFASRLPLAANPSLPLRWEENGFPKPASVPLRLFEMKKKRGEQKHRLVLDVGTAEALSADFSVLRSDGRVAAAPAMMQGNLWRTHTIDGPYIYHSDSDDDGSEDGDALGIKLDVHILKHVMIELTPSPDSHNWEGGAFLKFRLLFPRPVAASRDDGEVLESAENDASGGRGAAEGPLPPPRSKSGVKLCQISGARMSATSFPAGMDYRYHDDDEPLRFVNEDELLLLLEGMFIECAIV